jgi:hypothetical protein
LAACFVGFVGFVLFKPEDDPTSESLSDSETSTTFAAAFAVFRSSIISSITR